MIKVFKFDGEGGKVIEIENNLESYYKEIGCSLIEIPVRKIGDTYFDVVCDEEGLFVEEPKVTAIDEGYRPMLVGTLLICHHNEEGELTSLQEGDEETINNSILGLGGRRYVRVGY